MQKVDELSQAIAALEAQRAVLGDRVVDTAVAPLREKLAELEQRQPVSQQRRLVTVLFLDIVNSTLMSQGLEPEELLEIMGGTLQRLSAPIKAYGGKITRFMGDGFVAMFGLTRVHENDARQAVRAGLAILAESQACSEELAHRFQLLGFNIRIGINTGLIVAGRFSKAESMIMGLTVNLAARMEQAAHPGTLFITQFTHQHIRGAFDLETLPPIEAKGFPQPVTVYRVIAARPRTFRTFTRGVEGIETGLVGREAELRQLKAALTHAIHNQETHIVTVIGEAGVGKSRLLYEFDRWIARAPTKVIAFKAKALQQMIAVPFGLLREMISYRLDILTTDPVPSTRQKLKDAFSAYLDDEPEMKAHFVGSFLGFDFSDSPYLQGVENNPRQLRQRAQLYLAEYISAVAHKTPTVIMLDDIHWADHLSISFITQLVQECPRLPLLIICLARPTLDKRFQNWGQAEPGIGLKGMHLPRSIFLSLTPLSRQESLELLRKILRNVEALPDTLCERILDSADGNPFYIEEFIQSLVDTRIIQRQRRGKSWKLDPERLGTLELPATLVALLEARLDGLDPDQRALVQQASVIGRIFWRSALQAIHGEKLITDAVIKSLSMRGFIYPQETSTFADTEEYRFHHGLLRDVAYHALFKYDRQTYHAQVATWLIEATRECGRAGEFAPVIAEHYELAGEQLLAADWYTQSGIRAQNQGAPAQARTFFDRALGLLSSASQQSQTEPDLMRRWHALAGRDSVLVTLGDTEARCVDDIALIALAESIGNDNLLAEAYYRQGYGLEMIGKYSQELEAYNRGLEAARRAHDSRHEALILGLKVMCEVRLGALDAAAETCAEALVCAENLADDEVLARCLTNISSFYTEIGDLARSAQLLNQQLSIIHRIGNIEGEAIGLSNLGYTYTMLGKPEDGIVVLRRSIDLAREIGHRSFYAYASLNLALALLRSGNPLAALAVLGDCLPELQAMNDAFGIAVGQTYTALAKEQDGQVKGALADFEQAAASLGEIGILGSMHDAGAGVVRCRLVLNDAVAAYRYTAPLWDYLRQRSGAGMEFLLLGYETCADAFSAAGQVDLAQEAIEAGYRALMARASRISLPEWRQSFLEQVPEHHRILARWQGNAESRHVD